MAQAGSITSGLELPERYRVIRHIARGGMASVWEAEDGLLGRRVAVKVLAEHLAEDVTAGERFQREARAAARVSNHPNVVTIYDVGEHDGRTFIVMELYTGGTVAQRLKEGRPDTAVALEWLEQAAAAIDAAHESGLVHRDIKPGNLLIDERERLGVADFGIARLAHDQTVTHSGQILGTASYLSPEQARGEPASAASDRYSLAVVAYELLTGRRPFLEKHFAAQAQQHIEAIPPPASEVRRDLPAGVDAALGRGLSKVPGRRWNSASAMVASLQRALPAASVDETEATRAMPPPTRTAPKQTPPKSAPSRTGAKRPPTRTGARRSVAIGAAGAGAAAAEAGTHGSTGAAGPPNSTGAPPLAGFPPRRRPSRRILAVAAALVAIVALVAAIASAASSSGGGKVLAARVDHDTLKRAQDAADGRAAARRAKRSQTQEATQFPALPGAARGSTSGREGLRARRGASPSRRRTLPRRPRTPPRPCAARSCVRFALCPRGSRAVAVSSALEGRRAPRRDARHPVPARGQPVVVADVSVAWTGGANPVA